MTDVKTEMSQAVVPVKKAIAMDTRGVQLTSMDDAWRFCEMIAGTDLAPKGMGAREVFGVVQAGAELGVTPLRSLANMKIINGRVGPMGSLAKAVVRQAKVLEPGTGFKQWFTGKEFEDDFTAHISTLRIGEGEVTLTSFSVADAKRAALWGKVQKFGPSPWVAYPRRMLMWRAVGFHMDDYYSDVLLGLHIAEVLEDYPAPRDAGVMEPLDAPAKDPLLDELDELAATMQPPTEKEMLAVLPPDLYTPPELDTNFNDLVGPDGETILKIGHEPVDPETKEEVAGILAEAVEKGEADALLRRMRDQRPERVDPETGEYVEPPLSQDEIDDAISQKLGHSSSPLSAVMAEKAAEAEPQPMTEAEATEDLIREGLLEVKEEDLDDPDPANKALAGADAEDPP